VCAPPCLPQDNLNKRHPEMDALEEKLADAEVRGRWSHERETERVAIRVSDRRLHRRAGVW
jgi:hypothetical protein